MKAFKMNRLKYAILALSLLFTACAGKKEKLSIHFDKYTLSNGLTVVLHQDKSDPIVALAIQYHVGSNREVKGRTGFAHLFEHMMFQESEHVGQDQFFKKIQNAGGTLNGGTGNDGTTYFEVVPKNSLEMVLWLESDRMGYLDNTVTQVAFSNQQNVVQNEKRQGMDNRPYGFTSYLIDKTLFPDGHPYSWQVIGEMQDLQNATVADVKEFHHKFYVPNNATLVLAGDFDNKEAKAMIEKYFGEIPGGEKVVDLKPMNVTLDSTRRLFHEDNFAAVPQLTMVWPTVEQFSKESYALNFLGDLLADGKKAPLYKVLVEDKKLTSETSAYNESMELAGKFYIEITANEGIGLTEIERGIFEALAKFEKDGISDRDIERLKAKAETNFYRGISSILGKSFQLAYYNEYAGDPSFINTDLKNIKAVTREDILGVYNKYIKDKPYVLTSFVPKNKLELVAENSKNAGIVEEKITEATEVKQAEAGSADSIAKTPTAFDRTIEPAAGPDPVLNVPKVWTSQLANGMKMYGIEQHELPLVQFNIVLTGGQLLDDIKKPGVANLLAETLMSGTKTKTPEQLEEAIDLLGSDIHVYGTKESIVLSGSCLVRNYQFTLDLAKEILLEPRWDEKEFEIARTKVINNLRQRSADPNYMASTAFNKLIYGKVNVFSFPSIGTEASVGAISMDELKNYYNRAFAPGIASFLIAGDINQVEAEKSLQQFGTSWAAKEVTFPEFKLPEAPAKAAIYFVDMPGAKQSVITIGYLSLSRKNPDFYPATVMNYRLGGNFNSIFNMILREGKGFTYGARSTFDGYSHAGTFFASSSVRSNATQESVTIFRDEMLKYRKGISQEDFDYTRNAILKSNARKFETLGSLVSMLQNINSFGLPVDYIKQEEATVRAMTPETIKALAEKYILPDRMYYIVVGDAATQMKPLKAVGYGQPILYTIE